MNWGWRQPLWRRTAPKDLDLAAQQIDQPDRCGSGHGMPPSASTVQLIKLPDYPVARSWLARMRVFAGTYDSYKCRLALSCLRGRMLSLTTGNPHFTLP